MGMGRVGIRVGVGYLGEMVFESTCVSMEITLGDKIILRDIRGV